MLSAKTNHIGKKQSNEEQTTEKLAHKNVEWFCLELVLLFGQFVCIASSLCHRHRGTQVGSWQPTWVQLRPPQNAQRWIKKPGKLLAGWADCPAGQKHSLIPLN